MFTLSIIIPAYNASSYIQKCIESISESLNKSGFDSKELEVLVINDGSSDNTIELLEALCAKYTFLNVVSQNNSGVSAARNKGLKLAKGQYIQFIDADDSIRLLYFSEIIPFLKSEYDLLVFGFDIISHKRKRCIYKGENTELLKNYLKGNAKINIWSCLFRRNLIERGQLRFNEYTYYGEDREFFVKALILSKNTFYIHHSLYNYNLLNLSSAMNASYSSKRITSIEADIRILQFACDYRCSNTVVKLIKNQALFNYYFNKRLVKKKGDKSTTERLNSFQYLQKVTPPLQFTKFWVYNIYSWLLYKIKWI